MSETSEAEKSAVIHISRALQLPGCILRAHVMLDGEHVGALWIGQRLTVSAPPGTRLIRVEGRGLGALTLEPAWLKVRLAPGEVAAVRIDSRKGVLKSSWAAERVPVPRLP